MDKFTKGILTVIAVGIIGINIQMINGGSGFFTNAHAIGNDVQKVTICDERGFSCAFVDGAFLSVKNFPAY
jgi:hypothetical protein